MKQRLIDADALKEEIRTDVMGGLNYESFIKEAPTVDAVPVEEIAGIFGNPPCQYTFDCSEVQGDEFMYDHRWEWCEKNCMHVPCVDCWKQFFDAWEERRNDETDRR